MRIPSSSSSGARLICFDWGGVILRICRSWAEGCERAGLSVHEDDLLEEVRSARQAWAQRYQLGKVSCEAFREGIASTTRGRMSPHEIGLLHDAWLIEEYPGIAEVIDRLNTIDGVSTALLSNTNAGHWKRHLPQSNDASPDYPTAGSLDHRLGSHLLGLAKPDPAMYAAAERETGFASSQIVFFDDLAENVEAARASGWTAYQIDHLGDTASQIEGHLKLEGIRL